MGSMLGDNFVSLEDRWFSSIRPSREMRINRAYLVGEVGDANTVSRGGGHSGQLETSRKEKV
jgi:hypothetical protein